MRRMTILCAAVAWLGLGDRATAQQGGGPAAGPHGGTMAKTTAHQFEVVFTRGGLKVYPLNRDGKPLGTSGLSATATFYHPTSPNAWFSRDLRAASPGPGAPPGSLDLVMGLRSVPDTGAKVMFHVSGLSDKAEPAADFTVPVSFADSGTIYVGRATQADQPAISAQRVCKVSGEPLGSMGVPVKVTRGSASIFLCCQGCLKTVQAAPDRFLGAPASSRP